MKLRNQIFISVIVGGILPLMLAYFYAIWHSSTSTDQLVLDSAKYRLKASAARLNGYFNARRSEISLLAIQPAVVSMNFTSMRPILMQALEQKQPFYEKFIIGHTNGEFHNTAGGNPYLNMLRTLNDTSSIALTKNIKSRDYWLKTVGENTQHTREVYISNPMISYTTEVKQIVVASSILDNQKVVGLIGGTLPWDNIQNIINDMQIDLTTAFSGLAKLALISKDGNYWYHWEPNKVIHFVRNDKGQYILNEQGQKSTRLTNVSVEFPEYAQQITTLIDTQSSLSIQQDNEGRLVHHIFQPIGNTGYILQLKIDDQVLSAPTKSLINILIFSLVLACLFAMLVTHITTQKLTVPLLDFTQKIQTVGSQNLQPINFSSYTSEFNQLVDQFNLMINTLQVNQLSLSKSEERFSLAMQGANDGLWDWDLLTNEVYFSPRWKQMLGYEDHELENQLTSWTKLIYEPDAEKTSNAVKYYLDGHTDSYKLEFRMVHKDGHLVDILARAEGAKDESGRYVRLVGTHLDVTSENEHKRLLKEANLTLEDKVNARTLELQEINKKLLLATKAADSASQAKSLFLANMSHEIRTPMNGILGLTEILLRTELNDEQRDYLEKLQYSTNSLLYLLNDILDLSKIEAGKLTIEQNPFDFKKMLAAVIHILEVKAREKNITLDLNIKEPFPVMLLGDLVRCSQIFTNLISNAIKFTHEGGVQVDVCRKKDDDYIQVQISDTGIGITSEQQEKLFASFMQADASTSRKYGGTGLGLVICQHIIHLMKGEIRVTSEYGKGSCFTFNLYLPLVSQESLPLDITHEATNKDLNGSDTPISYISSKLLNKKALLVEDIAINRLVAKKVLVEAGLIVEFAVNGLEAVNMTKDNHYDLIIMDIQMPEMDGYEATKIIRTLPNYQSTPIIAVTANAMSDDKEKCLEVGMNSHLTKPFKFDQVIRELERYF